MKINKVNEMNDSVDLSTIFPHKLFVEFLAEEGITEIPQ
jgi:hypothetical protein